MAAPVTAPSNRLVVVVDDDESVRRALPDLLGALAVEATTFASAQEFLDSGLVAQTRCLILDVAMPGMSGPELQQELARRGHSLPIIFISGRTDDAMRERHIGRGAVDYLIKPFSYEQLRAALEQALGDL